MSTPSSIFSLMPNRPAPASESVLSPGAKPQLYRLSDLFGDFKREAQELHEAMQKGLSRGPVTGLPTLDYHLGGALVAGLHHVHGSPGVGKTAFGLQVASSCRCPSLYVTTEMSALELVRRLIARQTKTYLGTLRTGELTPDQAVALFATTMQQVSQLGLVDATTSAAKVEWLEGAATAMKGDERHLLIVVDSLHTWSEAVWPGTKEYEGLNLALLALRQLSSQLKCSVLAIVERNRDSMKKGGQSAGAGTRKIEYGADTVMELDAEEQEGEGVGRRNVTLSISKNRNGNVGGVVRLVFEGALQRYTEIE